MIVGVDNNATRLDAVRFARQQGVPAVFVALSTDGTRVNTFLQGSEPDSACWHCAQPNIDPQRAAPCAAAIISTCFAAAGHALFFCQRAMMGWPANVPPFNWREMDMFGMAPDRTGLVHRRESCPTCRR